MERGGRPMIKKIGFICIILLLLPLQQVLGEAKTIQAYLFPVKVYVDNVEKKQIRQFVF